MILISRIQRFSLHDGPGIRTTVFLKGCPICCPWCCNPENIVMKIQKYIENGNEYTYGVWVDEKTLYYELIKDKLFYDTVADIVDDWKITDAQQYVYLPGGVTFSGGEPLMQIDSMDGLFKKLKRDRIHMTIETSLYGSKCSVEKALKYMDLFYIDIKILEEERCLEVLGKDIGVFKSNFDIVLESGKPIILRFPVIGGYTDDESNRKRVFGYIKDVIKRGNVLKIELLKEHSLGLPKYLSLAEAGEDVSIPHYNGVENDLLEQYHFEIQKDIDIPVDVLTL